MLEQPPPPLPGLADVWYLKQILFDSRPFKIITQNLNGPCSFIAICNILILRGQIEILPHDRTSVSYEFLSQLIGEHLLTACPDIDISAPLSIMPSTTKGLDLNPQFTSITGFSPASDAGELALFAQAGIQLVHGWLVDPESSEAAVMAHIPDYDSAVTLIADADYITQGRLLGGESHKEAFEPEAGPSDAPSAGPSSALVAAHATSEYTDDERRKIEHAIVARQFLDATQSQLTYHGLFQLASTLEPGSLVALFRNAHLSVVYKFAGGERAVNPERSANPQLVSMSAGTRDADAHPRLMPFMTEEPALYALVTDEAFLHEPSVVWERLEDVDGCWSWFVDSDFRRAVPVGGDVAGQTAEGALRRFEMEAGIGVGAMDAADRVLAREMQAEEDARAREIYERALERRRASEAEARRGRERGRGRKKDKNCVIT